MARPIPRLPPVTIASRRPLPLPPACRPAGDRPRIFFCSWPRTKKNAFAKRFTERTSKTALDFLSLHSTNAKMADTDMNVDLVDDDALRVVLNPAFTANAQPQDIEALQREFADWFPAPVLLPSGTLSNTRASRVPCRSIPVMTSELCWSIENAHSGLRLPEGLRRS